MNKNGISPTLVHYIIIEDDAVSAQLLKKYVSVYEDMVFCGIFNSAKDAQQFLDANEVDLMFLDIEMPEIDGLKFLDKLEIDLMFIFVTSNPKYALNAFDYNPIHFLTKPLDKDKLSISIQRVRSVMLQKSKSDYGKSENIIIRENGNITKVPIKSIFYIKASADYMLINTTYKTYVVNVTLKTLSEQLPQEVFKKVHRSYIVNIQYIQKLEKKSLWINGDKIPIGPGKRSDLGESFEK
jgi:DNA-binding LytR/AlgR family response regulator